MPEVGETYSMSVNFRNSGKTPATNVLVNTVVDPIILPDEPNFSYREDPIARVGMIAPNGANFAPLHPIKSRSTGKDAPLTPELLDALKHDAVRLYVHGYVSYADIFGSCHWVTFCYYLTAPNLSSFSVCPDHNDTGEEECKQSKK
jgi:hypothetical protein